MSEPDDYTRSETEQLAQHLRLNDGKSGHVEAEGGEYHVYVRRKWPGKQRAEWDGIPLIWHESVGTHKAARR